jgi:hypothetical protein
MVVSEEDSAPYELERCGVSIDLRMTFYDHVHTTGIDIKQSLAAVAVVTLGKDMTLRDYSQGCWRMRALGKGQCIHLLFTPEIRGIISGINNASKHSVVTIVDVVAWLSVNSMLSEKMQWQHLQIQVLADCYRRKAVEILNENTPPSDRMSLVNFKHSAEPWSDISMKLAQVIDACSIYDERRLVSALCWVEGIVERILDKPEDTSFRVVDKSGDSYRSNILGEPALHAFMYVFNLCTLSCCSLFFLTDHFCTFWVLKQSCQARIPLTKILFSQAPST